MLEATQLNGINILIVEDEEIVALDMTLMLEKHGYCVIDTVSSGEDAIVKIEEKTPDLVLMDIKLKGKYDGIETARIISEQYHIPVVFVSAYSDEKTLEQAGKLDPAGYLRKPVNFDELKSVVQNLLSKEN